MPEPLDRPERREPLPGVLGLPGHLWRRLPERWRLPVLAGTVVLLAGVLWAFAVVAPERRDARERAVQAADRRAAAGRARRRAALAAAARPHVGRGPADAGVEGPAALRARRGLVAALEDDVAADGRRRARSGEVRGAFADAECEEHPRRLDVPAPQEDLSRATADLACLAVADRAASTPDRPGATLGQPYRARVDFRRGRFVVCRIVGRGGELAIGAEQELRVPAACGGA